MFQNVTDLDLYRLLGADGVDVLFKVKTEFEMDAFWGQ